jgi:Tfp pilus assembly protein PilV
MTLPTPRDGRGSEAGETLIELLLSSTLMAVVVVAILGALGTMVSASSLHRDQAKANDVLVAAMEKVKSQTRVPCASNPSSIYAGHFSDADLVAQLPSGWASSQIQITDMAYQGDPSGGVMGWSATCSDTLPLQRITITVTNLDGRVKPSLTFVKGAF